MIIEAAKWPELLEKNYMKVVIFVLIDAKAEYF